MSRPSDQVYSILLVGLGGMGRVWLDRLTGPAAARLGVHLIALCDVDAARAAEAVATLKNPLSVHSSITDALREAPNIVIDCTTPNARIAIVGEALKHGAHVLCEKPLAATEDEARRLLGIASRAHGHLAVSQNRRFHPGVRQLRDLVNGNTLGRPQRLTASLHMAPRFGGFREKMRHVMLRDMAIHAFDAARAILRQDAVSVICINHPVEGSRFVHGSDVTAVFAMSGGAQFCFDGSWTDAGPPSSWNGSWRLSLAHGSARWDGEGDALAYVAAAADDDTTFLPVPASHSLEAMDGDETDIMGALASFVAALRAGTLPETHVRDNVRSLAMAMAAIRSADAGGRSEPVTDLALSGDSTDFPNRLAPLPGDPTHIVGVS